MTQLTDSICSSNGMIKLARSKVQIADVRALWKRVYKDELSWIGESSLIDHELHNCPNAEHYVAYDENREAVGTMRALFGNYKTLPTASLTDVKLCDAEDLEIWAEFGRLMVNSDVRRRKSISYPYGVFAGLCKFAIARCVVKNIRHVVTNVQCRGEPNSLVNSLVIAGFQETNTRFYDEYSKDNPPCTALHLDIANAQGCSQGGNPLYEYLFN
jgi:hypothetical protein